MAKKVYAIKEGFDFSTNQKVENKIVNTWAECLKYIKGVKGAKYKSFEKIEEAKQFLTEASKLLKKGIDKYPQDCLHIYVDGSYNLTSKKYSYGVVAVRNNVIEYIDSKASNDSSQSNIRQIAGELEGAVRGVEYALSKNDSKVVIFHDYEGIAHHATGFWERREASSIEYYDKMNNFMKSGIDIIFVKVDSHTGDFFNELADEKCKEALDITSDRVVENWLLKNKVIVDNLKIKNQVLTLAPSCESNIELADKKTNKVESSEKVEFIDIINEFVVNEENGIKLIKKLQEDKKVDFIEYLIKKLNVPKNS